MVDFSIKHENSVAKKKRNSKYIAGIGRQPRLCQSVLCVVIHKRRQEKEGEQDPSKVRKHFIGHSRDPSLNSKTQSKIIWVLL